MILHQQILHGIDVAEMRDEKMLCCPDNAVNLQSVAEGKNGRRILKSEEDLQICSLKAERDLRVPTSLKDALVAY